MVQNYRKKRVTGNMTPYETKISEKNIGGKTVSLVNLTPRLSADEKREVKAAIEKKLYDVFCKYLSVKH